MAPENLPKVTNEDYHDKCQALIDEGFCKDIDDVYRLIDILEDKKPLNDLQKITGEGEPAHQKPFIKKIQGNYKPGTDYKLKSAPQNKMDGKPPMI